MAMSNLSSEEIAQMMETYISNKYASYEKNLQRLGAIDLETPASIVVELILSKMASKKDPVEILRTK